MWVDSPFHYKTAAEAEMCCTLVTVVLSSCQDCTYMYLSFLLQFLSYRLSSDFHPKVATFHLPSQQQPSICLCLRRHPTLGQSQLRPLPRPHLGPLIAPDPTLSQAHLAGTTPDFPLSSNVTVEALMVTICHLIRDEITAARPGGASTSSLPGKADIHVRSSLIPGTSRIDPASTGPGILTGKS